MSITEAEIRELRAVAATAARRGGEVLRERFHRQRTVTLKGQIDLVTDADRASEDAVLTFLRGAYPTHHLIAEESAAPETLGSGPRWYVDPLDGTTNYAHGVPHFCVSVAVWDEGVPLAGAVYHPLLDDLYSAGRGQGATINEEPLRVSTRAPLGQALVGTGFPYDIWDKPDLPLRLFTAALGQARGLRRLGAAALDLAYVAQGRFEAYYELGLFAWDVAAGILLVQEAGGLVSDFHGQAAKPDGRQILAGNPAVHGELLALLDPLTP